VHLAGDTFTFTLLQKEIYKFCTSITICEDNTAINCITVQDNNTESSFLSNLMDHISCAVWSGLWVFWFVTLFVDLWVVINVLEE
jgi:hypothetical protein